MISYGGLVAILFIIGFFAIVGFALSIIFLVKTYSNDHGSTDATNGETAPVE